MTEPFCNPLLWIMEADTTGLQELSRAVPDLLQLASSATQLYAVSPFYGRERNSQIALEVAPRLASGQSGWAKVLSVCPSGTPGISVLPATMFR